MELCCSQVDGLNSLHSVKASANRFTKTSQGRSWNTGNGSPDAICFAVDKPGIVVVGFSVYGGGGIHEYELEVLVDDVSITPAAFFLLCGYLSLPLSRHDGFKPSEVLTDLLFVDNIKSESKDLFYMIV